MGLAKASAMLKPFLPQLQTTFLKALNDTNRTVRLKAGQALSHLIGIHTRPDPLYNELFQYVSHLLKTKFCNSLSSMCCVGFDVFFPFQYHMSPWASKLLYSFIIHRCRRSRRRFVSIILLLSPFYTHSLPAIKHLHPQK